MQWWLLAWEDPASGWIDAGVGQYGVVAWLPDSVASGQPLGKRLRLAHTAFYWQEPAGSMIKLVQQPEPAASVRVEADHVALAIRPSPALRRLWQDHPDSLRFFSQSPWEALRRAIWVHPAYTR